MNIPNIPFEEALKEPNSGPKPKYIIKKKSTTKEELPNTVCPDVLKKLTRLPPLELILNGVKIKTEKRKRNKRAGKKFQKVKKNKLAKLAQQQAPIKDSK